MVKASSFILGPYIEFIFEDYHLTNLTDGDKCLPKKYELTLSYFPNQSPGSDKLG